MLFLWLQAALAYTCAILDEWDDLLPPPPNEIHWLCPDAVSPDGTTWDMSSVGDVAYRLNENDFSNAEMDEIEQAANAWEGGWSKVNRGVWLELTRTQGAGDGALDNGVNNVRRKPNSYFNTHGYGGGTKAFVLLYVDNDCEQIPPSTALGSYRLCARINDDYAVSETSLVDNLVGSEAVFQVVSCP